MRIIGGLERKQRAGHPPVRKHPNPAISRGCITSSPARQQQVLLQLAWYQPVSLGTAAHSSTLPTQDSWPPSHPIPLRGHNLLRKHQKEQAVAHSRLTHWSKINREVAGCNFKQLLHKGTCRQRREKVSKDTGQKRHSSYVSTHDRPALQLLKCVRDQPRPGQTQEPSLQQLKEKRHVSFSLKKVSSAWQV